MLTGTSINENKLAVNVEARQNKREVKIGRRSVQHKECGQ